MKLLSDFDGVWTVAAEEARAVFLYFRSEAARMAGVDPELAQSEFERYRTVVHGSPERHGWRHQGRVTAYVDEDPFCLSNTLGAFLADTDDETAWKYRDGIVAAGHESTETFADHCFLAATTAYRREHPPALVPTAAAVVQELGELEVHLVIVSNSPPEKILGWFAAEGIDHDPELVRVRGNAGKHVLGLDETYLDAGERRVRVDRPGYRTILEEEAPDLVLGDVFSLDLALPCWLRNSKLAGAPRHTVLHAHAHTPAWTHGLSGKGPIDRIVNSIEELPGLARELARPSQKSARSSS